MSTLVVALPSRPRLRAHSSGSPEPLQVTEYAYALSPDGIAVASQGRVEASLLPRADTVVAVLSDSDVSWHRIVLPKAPASKLQAALVGVLEDALLDDAASVHLAVAPQASAGDPTWIAAIDRDWLSGSLKQLESANVFVDRVVPMCWPDDPPAGHFAEAPNGAVEPEDGATITWAHADGVIQMPLQGGLARAVLPNPLPENVRWSATPAMSVPAEKWLGTRVAVMTPAQRALQASRSLWNLRQFGLARKNRGTRALRDAWRQFMSPAWRPLRFGLIALVLVQIGGLNLWAWKQRHTIDTKQRALVNLLQTTYPHVRGVLDAPLQMQRETDALRATAGRPGETDLEPMLAAAASAWPSDRPPVDGVRYEPGRLTLAAVGWAPEQIEEFRSQIYPAGWQVEALDGNITITRRPVNAAVGRSL